jgi:hypothetical protein
MSSNTSIGRGEKGSKFWIQTLVNLDGGTALTKVIQNQDSEIGDIKWESPLSKDKYEELKTEKIEGITKKDLDFWPSNGPWWDGVGTSKDTIILVEAKAHINETFTKCSAISTQSISKIKTSMEEVYNELSNNLGLYDENVWFKKYYQIANRLTFLVKLKQKGFKVKLVLLNIVDDPTHIKTSEDDWNKHYKEVFNNMLGSSDIPKDVIMVNFNI